uniref:Uncharacterized protein n=1 Tax=Anguilla anguilla TaxID=7936 RepID=A0A0E9W4Q9_ANGAN
MAVDSCYCMRIVRYMTRLNLCEVHCGSGLSFCLVLKCIVGKG